MQVRMGLHVGLDVRPRDDDYVALAVHQAARVTAAASGGQILVTQAVVDRCVDEGDFADLGSFSVRDFDGPVRLFQLSRPGRSATRPRLPFAFDSHLPTYRTALVGRDAEIDEVGHQLGRAPLVTLTGPIGIGKTRLAVAVLSQLTDATAVGPWFVDLGAAEDSSAVWDLICRAVGRPGDVKLAVHLDRLLDGRPSTLVLDGCEHVSGAAATAVQLLLDWNPTLRVLATSREPLNLPGEVVYAVPPLALPATDEPMSVVNSPAGRLFLERLRRAGVDGTLTAETAAVVHGVCLNTGGVPYALELVAGMCAGLPPNAPSTWPAATAGAIAPLVSASLTAAGPAPQRALAALAVPPQPLPRPLVVAALGGLGVDDAEGMLADLGRRGLVDLDVEGCRLSLPVRQRALEAMSADDRRTVTSALLRECLVITSVDPVPLARHDDAATVGTWLLSQDGLDVAERQRLAAQLTSWWTGRLGTRRAREHLTAALALGRTGRATAAVHLALADTYPPGEETVDTEMHIREAARLLGEYDAVDPSLVSRIQAVARRAAAGPVPGD